MQGVNARRGPGGRARATQRAVAAAAALVLALLGAPLLLGYVTIELDAGRLDVGALCAMDAQRDAGHGLWLSTFLGLGAPLFGWHYSGLFYPPRWIAWLFSPMVGASVAGALHLVTAAASTTWLARTFRMRPATSVAVGALFALSGTCLDLLSKAEFKAGAAWLPLVWAGARTALGMRGRAVGVGAVAVGGALLLFGGEPQAFGLALALVGAECAVFIFRHRAERRRLPPVLLAAAGALAAGLVLWLPALAEAALTPRGAPLAEGEVFRWSLGPEGALSFVWPGAFTRVGAPGLTLHQWVAQDLAAHVPWNNRAYFGLLPMALVVLSARTKRARIALVVGVVGLVAALGDRTPVMPLLVELIEPLGRFRYPAKYLLVTTLACALAAGLGVEQLRRSRAARRQLLVFLGLILATNGIATLALAGAADSIDASARALAAGPVVAGPALSSVVIGSALQAAAAPLVALLLLWRAPRHAPWLAALVVLDLAVAAPSHVRWTEHAGLPPSPADSLSAPASATPAEVDVLCTTPAVSALEVVDEEGRVHHDKDPVFLWGVPDAHACRRVSSGWSYSAPLVSRTAHKLRDGVVKGSAAAARALGCTHVVKLVDGEPRLLALRDALPPVFVVEGPVWTEEARLMQDIPDARSAAEILRHIDDPRDAVSAKTPLPDGRGVAVAERRWLVRDEAELELSGEGGAVVGLRSAYWLGWSAHQGGRALPVVRAGYGMVAAIVDDVRAGPVTFRYRPPRLGLGAGLSLLGLLLAAAAIWLARRRK
jgi:hypothetical protein